MSLHIGKLIQKKLDESNLSRKVFAERIHKSRSHLYKIFSRDFISTDDLLLISRVLKHNFFQYFAEELKQYTYDEDHVSVAEREQQYQTAINQLEEKLKGVEKENEYLKEINGFLKEKVEQLSNS